MTNDQLLRRAREALYEARGLLDDDGTTCRDMKQRSRVMPIVDAALSELEATLATPQHPEAQAQRVLPDGWRITREKDGSIAIMHKFDQSGVVVDGTYHAGHGGIAAVILFKLARDMIASAPSPPASATGEPATDSGTAEL